MVEPFFFGQSPKLLFGVYHPPQKIISQDIGIVLCYPMGQEYIRTHRAFFQLANQLSLSGFHVLRFDYYGCGDSMGDYKEGSIRQWINDINTAVNELKEGCGTKKVMLIGLRLGATLSMIAAEKYGGIDCIVLWNPILNGKAYICELSIMHREYLEGSFVRNRNKSERDEFEIMGFSFPKHMIDEMKKINLFNYTSKGINHFLVVENSINDSRKLSEMKTFFGEKLTYKKISDGHFWIKKNNDISKRLVPKQSLDFIDSWICKEFS